MGNNKLMDFHRFLDEAGDTTFYGKGKKNIIGENGVSKVFILGMIKVKDPLDEVRDKINQLQQKIISDEFYHVPSVLKKINKTGYYLHATDDLPEVRKEMFDLMKTINCSFEAVVGRKDIERYETKHKGKEEYFYADLLSHLLKNKLSKHDKLVMHISERGKSTKNHNLELAFLKAKQRFSRINGNKESKTKVVFNVNYPTKDPLLNLADYFCWSIQRVFERGEIRYYNHIKDQIKLVIDLYDTEKYDGWKNYYDNRKNPLTSKNKISPLKH
ncbi:DUF3800 domain-containing protein [Tamlana sp. s12]|uniref:DUF3800 domain-containing protein n=1 Tax=Flavobacteriaceae TaxID=49546 RepID=UPI0008013BC0|nr:MULTISPECIES: DUF3800 domain-containing protein [Tamlana]OBQ55100.1 hypothetical protein VQ01_10215 [Tamlana sp. s12]QQY83208.1 DUF3800 domain-containing protein [Tamlana sp. s12]